MSDFSFEVQKAIYAALTAGSPPAIAEGRVYDSPPENVAFPHVEIGEVQSIPDDTSKSNTADDEGISEFRELHIWSRYNGYKEAIDIGSQIHAALHGVSLTVTGRASALAWVRNKRFFRDPDGVTRHGVVSIEVIHRT